MDAGLQAERTTLAWTRTAVLGMLVGVLAARVLLVHDVSVPRAAVLAVALQILPLWVIATARQRLRVSTATMCGARPASIGRMLPAMMLVLFPALVGVLVL